LGAHATASLGLVFFYKGNGFPQINVVALFCWPAWPSGTPQFSGYKVVFVPFINGKLVHRKIFH